jgi:hypothetical protein
MSEAALASFVQFPHPGGEHRPPPTDHMPWNTADHRRKYLLADGAYLDADHGTVKTGQLVFWGEWEPPSIVVHRWAPSDGLPRALHQPYWARPPVSTGGRNTGLLKGQ